MFSMELQELAHRVRDVLDDPCTAPLRTGDPDLDIALAAVRGPRRDNERWDVFLSLLWVSGDMSAYTGHADRR